MILQLLKYFAGYPQKEGVLSMFSNGASQFPEYVELMEHIEALPDPRLPEIENFVFGQSYDTVKQRIDTITGNYLFIDFGEFSSTRSSRNSISDKQKLAATIAMKVEDTADTVEVGIVSQITLSSLVELRKLLIRDSETQKLPWDGVITDQQDIIPFVSPEFKSIGWTFMFSTEVADLFGVKSSFTEY